MMSCLNTNIFAGPVENDVENDEIDEDAGVLIFKLLCA